MFDKIPSLKDFIIYFIPGVLICYFGFNIINHHFSNVLLLSEKGNLNSGLIVKSPVLTFIGILFSFLTGFFLSQLLIIQHKKFIERKGKKILTIKNSKISEKLKEKVAFQIKRKFELNNCDENFIANDPEFIYLCLNYIKTKGNEETNRFIDRSSNLSSFAISSVIPVLLGLYNIFLIMKVEPGFISIFIAIILLIIYFAMTIAMKFREVWVRNIYLQFLILSQ